MVNVEDKTFQTTERDEKNGSDTGNGNEWKWEEEKEENYYKEDINFRTEKKIPFVKGIKYLKKQSEKSKTFIFIIISFCSTPATSLSFSFLLSFLFFSIFHYRILLGRISQ